LAAAKVTSRRFGGPFKTWSSPRVARRFATRLSLDSRQGARKPSTLESWVINIRQNIHDLRCTSSGATRVTTIGRRAQYPADGVYTTSLLPGFELPVTPTW
jgi:hypothetical protein